MPLSGLSLIPSGMCPPCESLNPCEEGKGEAASWGGGGREGRVGGVGVSSSAADR